MFIGREKELEEIKTTLETKNKHVLVYGARRVGKTTLIKEATIQSKLKFVSFECLKSSLKDNLSLFTENLEINNLIPKGLVFDSFINLFRYLDTINEHIVFLIDEYPYLYEKENREYVDSVFQTIIDNYSSNINIVLSGSHIGMMKTLLESTNPLYARFACVIHLLEMDYLEASKFYPNKSNYEKVQFYSVFGGSPYILCQLDSRKSLKENIINTYLNDHSSIKMFISEGFTSDENIRNVARNIFRAIGNGKERYKELETKLSYQHNGLLSKQLNTMLDMELLEKIYPINKKDSDKKTTYVISSNAIRFYYTYIYGKDNLISILGQENFYNTYIEKTSNDFVAHRFEEQARVFVSKLIKAGKLTNVENVGTYYYDDVENKKNGEFDVVVKETTGYTAFEVKFLNKPVSNEIINKEIQQIKSIKELNINKLGFISINGFETKDTKLDYYFDGNDIYFDWFVQKSTKSRSIFPKLLAYI